MESKDKLESFKKKYNRLTAWEKFTIGLRFPLVGRVSDDTDTAYAEARRRFPAQSLEDGPGDAFRHCYWSALLARDCGVGNTLAITTAHEDFDENPADKKDMDLRNNREGILIGMRNKQASNAELADLCEKALRAGKLKVLKP